MKEIYNHIRKFWDSRPCGTTHIGRLPGTKDYFLEMDRYYQSMYPYLLPFLDLDSLRKKRVLEIGLGSGFTLSRFTEVARVSVGVDVSINTLRLNQARNKHCDFKANLVQASATQLPLSDNTFDTAISIGCLHHIPDIEQAISEIYRVLKPGGYFKGMLYNRNSYRFRVYIPLARRLSPRWRGKDQQSCVNEMYDGSGNPYGMVYSKGEVLNLFGRFSDIEFSTQNFVGDELLPKLGGYIPRRFWLATLGRIIGLDLYFTAKAVK